MAMMFMGRLTFILEGGSPHGPDESFLVSSEAADGMTRTALLIVSDLNTIHIDGVPLRDIWQRIYGVTAFFAGFADDLTVGEYQAAAGNAAGERFHPGLLGEETFLEDFRENIVMSYSGQSIYSGTGQSVIMPDGSGNFYPEVSPVFWQNRRVPFLRPALHTGQRHPGPFRLPLRGKEPAGEQRFMPSGLDVAGAFRCPGALEILENDGTLLFSHYRIPWSPCRG